MNSTGKPQTKKDELRELIKSSGLNDTRPRRDILHLLKNEHGPFSADEILQMIGPGSCDQATVFRTLKQFLSKGLVNSISLNEGFIRYEFNDPKHHHHHIICRNCQKLETIDECLVKGLEKKLALKGYTKIDHSLEFFGLCPDCSEHSQ
jgi:Fur family ferric uptake transcriptional regulator